MYKERRGQFNRQLFISSNSGFEALCAVISEAGYNCSLTTSPLEGEVCFPFETMLKTRKQGVGYLSQCKVESGKLKVNPFLPGWGGCRAATGGVSQNLNPPRLGRMSRGVNPRSDRRGDSTWRATSC